MPADFVAVPTTVVQKTTTPVDLYIKQIALQPGDAATPSVVTIVVDGKDASGLWLNQATIITVQDDPLILDPNTGLPPVGQNPDPNSGRRIPATRLFEIHMQSLVPASPLTNSLGIANGPVRAALRKYLQSIGKMS